LKIVIIEPNAHLAGHYSQELHSFCAQLARSVTSVSILTPHGFKDSWGHIEGCEVLELLPGSRPVRRPSGNALLTLYDGMWEFFKACRRQVELMTPDVVHIWGFVSVFPVWYHLRASRTGIRTVLTLKAVKRLRTPLLGIAPLGTLQGFLSDRLLRAAASCYVVHTGQLRRQALDIGIHESDIHLVPTGIESHRSLPSRQSARQNLELGKGSTILLIFGVIRDEKGVFERSSSWKEPRQPSNLFLQVRMDGGTTGGRDTRKGDRRASSSFLKYIPEEEIGAYFRAADVVVIGHRPEFAGESGVLLRAVEYEVPVVAPEENHAAELVHQYKIGEVFKWGSRESFFEAVGKVVQTVRDDPARIRKNLQAFEENAPGM